MKIIGLTGGVASGKNFVTDFFKKNGAEIFDADKEVHNIFEYDKSAVSEITKHFPEAVINKKIDRKVLGKIVFADKNKLLILEKIIHPKIRKNYADFLAKAKKDKAKFIVLNIPLLLEKQAYQCDKIVSLVISPAVQKKRFLGRAKKNNSDFNLKILEDRFEKIRKNQMSNKERKEKSDFVINTSLSKAKTLEQAKEILKKIL